MKILRAHYYDDVEMVKSDLSRLPRSWFSDIDWIPWIILPNDLSPKFIGLLRDDLDTDDGRTYNTVGGWSYVKNEHPNFALYPHIFLQTDSWYAAIHEVGHALEAIWNAPIEDLYKPDLALYSYMASESEEYFACALDAFCSDESNMRFGYHRFDLAQADRNIYDFFLNKLAE